MKNKTLLVILILTAACLMQFASDIYTPSLPAISSALAVPSSLVKWTLAIYMFAGAFGQLIYGPISEGIGRKCVLLFGLVIFIAGTVVCICANGIGMLLTGRFVQGIGIASVAALSRPIFRDLFSGNQLAKIGSYAVMITVWVVAAAPMLGGVLQVHFGWRSSFVFLLIYSILMAVVIKYFVPETNQHHHVERLKLRYIMSVTKQIISAPFFWGLTLCCFLAYGGIFAWVTAGPFLLIDHLGLSPATFGWILGLGGGLSASLSAIVNTKCVTRFGGKNMIRFGVASMLAGGVTMLILYYALGMQAWSIFLPAFIFYFGTMFVFPNIFGLVFTPFGKVAGYVGSLYGCIQSLGGAVLGGVVSHTSGKTPVSLAIILISVAVLICLSFETTKNHIPRIEA